MQNPAQSLLLEYLHPLPDAHLLLLEGGDGWLAAEAAKKVPAGEVLSLTRDWRQVLLAKSKLRTLPNADATLEVVSQAVDWDIVMLTIPKERRYTRFLLIAAWDALKFDGQLLIAGPSKGGAKAVIKDAERLFGNARVLGYRNHQRAAICLRKNPLPEPLPEEFRQPGISPGTHHFVQISHPGGTLNLETHPGIFSWEALDEGTALLLEHMKIVPGIHVWDVGCGYGVIGLTALLAGAGQVTMSDVNLLAVQFAKINAQRNGILKGINVFASDGLQLESPSPSQTARFDLIVSNPAFHQGRDIDKSMASALITRSPHYLASKGKLLIVANRFLNYDRLMRSHFQHVVKLAETNKFHVIEASQRI